MQKRSPILYYILSIFMITLLFFLGSGILKAQENSNTMRYGKTQKPILYEDFTAFLSSYEA